MVLDLEAVVIVQLHLGFVVILLRNRLHAGPGISELNKNLFGKCVKKMLLNNQKIMKKKKKTKKRKDLHKQSAVPSAVFDMRFAAHHRVGIFPPPTFAQFCRALRQHLQNHRHFVVVAFLTSLWPISPLPWP